MDSRDEDAFAAFVAARSRVLRRTAYVLTGDAAAADDLLQDSLIKVYLSWSRIRDLGAVEDYTRRVMVRTHISLWRRVGRREAPAADPSSSALVAGTARAVGMAGMAGTAGTVSLTTPAGTHDVDQRDELWRALATLGPRQRAVIVLRFYEDLTEPEIARLLGCSVGTVKSQLSRGLARLGERISATRALEDQR